jgi:error-prone DNA polymerase
MTGRARYAELQVTSHFSFLRGASSCEELFAQAALLGIEALAVVDRNSLAGIVRAHEAAKTTGVQLIVGCRLDLADGMSILAYPTDRPAYSRLCRLLSLGKGRAGKAKCHLDWDDVVAYGEGLIAVLVPDEADDLCAVRLRRLRGAFGDRAYMALTLRRRPNDQLRLYELAYLAAAMRVPTVVTNDVLFHEPARRMMQDVVTCIRHNVTIDDAGFRRERHADRYLKPGDEMARLFSRYPEALARTVEIADRCRFSLDELAYQYPEEKTMPGLTSQRALEKLTWEGAARRYPEGLPDKVIGILKHELRLIETLEYAPYFLTVNSIVRFARSQDILCQGRGSAANSAVCYVLGITSIDPERNNLLFERFVSQERREPPAHEAQDILRSRHRGRDRSTRSDPGRHGASLSSPARRDRRGDVSDAGARARSRQDPWRAAISGAGDAGLYGLRRLFRRRGRPTAPRHGHLQTHRRRLEIPRQVGQRHDRQRLQSGIC